MLFQKMGAVATALLGLAVCVFSFSAASLRDQRLPPRLASSAAPENQSESAAGRGPEGEGAFRTNLNARSE